MAGNDGLAARVASDMKTAKRNVKRTGMPAGMFADLAIMYLTGFDRI